MQHDIGTVESIVEQEAREQLARVAVVHPEIPEGLAKIAPELGETWIDIVDVHYIWFAVSSALAGLLPGTRDAGVMISFMLMVYVGSASCGDAKRLAAGLPTRAKKAMRTESYNVL